MPKGHIVTSELLAVVPSLTMGLSTRVGGFSAEPFGMNLSFSVGDDEEAVRRNRMRFFSDLGISEADLAIPSQCHSATVKIARRPEKFESTDGLVTATRNLWLVVSVADCVPVFFADRKQGVVAAVHAGWRGTSQGISARAMEAMEEEFGCKPEDLSVFIGPSAGACCYQVGGDVASQFPDRFIAPYEGGLFLDLKEVNRHQLTERGVGADMIEVSTACTICDTTFHSYRRDKEKSGRMLGVIGLRA